MRMFLPIKGPGGRALTPREKVALIVLGVTLVLCVLTLLAGEQAWHDEPARNPVFAVVEFLCQLLGGGIVACYGIVLLWSALIYFKGEKIADITPLGGRLAALLAVTVGISGLLGISRLEIAGDLGLIVGGALGNTFGAFWSFPILLMLLLLGLHIAGQGAWQALREPTPLVAAGAGAQASVGIQPGLGGVTLKSPPPARVADGPPLPDDGDPSSDERTFAVTQAMEEIERSQGVTIVDMEPDTRTSIGEQVAEAPPPEEGSEEDEVRQGVDKILEAVAEPEPEEEEEEEEWEDEEDYEEESEEEEPAEEDEEEDDEEEEEDPYARGGLLRRIEHPEPPAGGAERPFTNFDWRGRPIDE